MSDVSARDLWEPDGDDLDRMTRAELAELGMPGELAHVLDDWLLRHHGIFSSGHNVGCFLDLLAAAGYRVTPIEGSFDVYVLPPPAD